MSSNQADLPALAAADLAPLPSSRTPATVYLAGLSSGSQRTMRAALVTLAGLLTNTQATDPALLPWWLLRYEHTAALRARLAERYSAATANKHLAALRGVLRTCRQLGLMSADDQAAACDVSPVKGPRPVAGRALSSGELAALLAACSRDTSPAGARDAALLACLYPGGLRRAELVALDRGDFDPDTGALVVRSGKGSKGRVVYLANGARRACCDWLAVRGDQAGALFVAIRKGGTLTGRRISDQAVLHICQQRAQQAGVAPFSPHDLRRTTIGDLLDSGIDMATVQQFVGHSSPETTSRYDRRGERAKQQAAGRLHLPYFGRQRS
jgi:integrase